MPAGQPIWLPFLMPSSDSTSPTANRTARSIVYIDGFNLYYGAIKGGSHKWLNLEKYFQRLRPHDDIKRIYYFTAKISGSSQKNQAAYLGALATLPLVEVRLGRFKLKNVKCKVQACSFVGHKLFKTPEEKQTDVAIGIQMVVDAFDDSCDRFILVTGDSDLLPAIRTIKLRYPRKKLILYVPANSTIRGAATELRGATDKDKSLPLGLLRHCHLPAEVPDGAGGFIKKPTTW